MLDDERRTYGRGCSVKGRLFAFEDRLYGFFFYLFVVLWILCVGWGEMLNGFYSDEVGIKKKNEL